MAGRRKLAVNVSVPATAGLPARFFAAGEAPSEEYAEIITNPKAWGDDPSSARRAVTEPSGSGGSGGADGPVPPPKGGAGSGAEEWRKYAAALEVEVDAEATREDVIAALEKAGKPTEVEPA